MKYMDITEFRESGYLQEVNRRFFHPLGLALEVEINGYDGTERLGRIWDRRDDPEGIVFSEVDPEKACWITNEFEERSATRRSALGFDIQPGPSETEWLCHECGQGLNDEGFCEYCDLGDIGEGY